MFSSYLKTLQRLYNILLSKC